MAADFTKPGDDGGKKPAKLHHKTDVAFPLPAQLKCGEVYAVRFRTQQRVGACDALDADYPSLYKRANDLAQMRAGKLDCSLLADCPKTHMLRHAARWDCNNKLAYAEVVYAVYCTAMGAPLKDIWTEPDPDDFSQPKSGKALEDLDMAGAREERIVESIPKGKDIDGMFLGCPETQAFVYTYHELVKECPPANFQAYVTNAENAAKPYYESFLCDLLAMQACALTATIVRREWDCVAHGVPIDLFHEVVVKLYIELVCQ